MREGAAEAAPPPSVISVTPAKLPIASDDTSATPKPPVEIMASPTSEAENQLRSAVAHYRAADEETRTDIEEHLSELADSGVSKRDIARTLGAMFTMENSVVIKCSILDELYTLGDPAVLEQVTVGLLPNQPLEVRDEAISILQDIGDKRAIPSLQPLLADPDENIRDAARDAIDSLTSRKPQ
jgi:HEAT repeat protein